jgi:proline iminopeptidase
LPTITANGLQLTYETDGDPGGMPLLLIMGLGMQLTSWPQSLVQLLVDHGYYVIRYDNRDCGLSSILDHHGTPNVMLSMIKSMLGLRLKSTYKLSDMANDALALLDALGIGEAHVVGVSMGGMIAQVLTASAPQRVKSLTSIMSSSGRRGLPGPTRRVRNMLLKRPRGKLEVIEHFVRLFQTIGSPGYPTPPEILRARVQANMARSSTASGTSRQMLAIVASGSRTRLLGSIERPTLIIHGRDDALVPLACGEDCARAIPGAVLRVVPGMGHDLPDQLMPLMCALIHAHCQLQEIPQVRMAA